MGEVIVWVGASLFAIPSLKGWEYLSLISPVFVYLLVSRVSGVNILEQRADKKWGGNVEYEQYKKTTPVLFPLLGCRFTSTDKLIED